MGMIIGSSMAILMVIVDMISEYRKEKEQEEGFRKQQAMNNNA
jgi:hypothetical protein